MDLNTETGDFGENLQAKMKNTFKKKFPETSQTQLFHKRLMFLSRWVKNKQQSDYVDLHKMDFWA